MNLSKSSEKNKTIEMRDYSNRLNRFAIAVKDVLLDRVNVCLLLVGLIYWAFRPFFEQLLLQYWVTPFIAYFQNGVLTRIVAWTVIVGIVVKCGIACKDRKRISGICLYRWGLVTVIWSAVRFSEAWSFIPLTGNLTYFDIVPFYAFSIGVVYICQFIKNKPSVEIEEEGFLCDEPIEKGEEDLLGRNDFAQTLARRMLKTFSKHQSFAVGILSSWGYGKTSFLNLIKDELKLHHAICIDFSPWIYGNDKDLIKEFFTEVGTNLRRYADILPRDMMEYARILEKNESTSWLSMLLSLENKTQNLKQQGDLLKQSLKKINRPIVVFIDDLDRLGGSEVMEVLKLIRNAANFSEIKFVVAYDRTYLVEIIKKQNIELAEYYLEKIFQVEYTLPVFERERLETCLKEECRKFIQKDDHEALDKVLDSDLFGIAIEEIITLRDVKRYVNSLKNSYKKLKGNVVLRDLMNLEILRLKYKSVYELLSRQWKQILMYEDGVLQLYKSNNGREKETSYYQQLPSYEINTLLKDMGYTELEINRIIRILNFLFPSFPFPIEYGAINNKATIARYFYDTIQERDLPIDVFKCLWQNEYECMKSEIDNIIARHQTFSFVSQLDSFTPNTSDVCKKVVRAMFYLGNSNSIVKNSYISILNKINSLANYLNTSNANAEIKQFLLSIVKENGLSGYISDFLLSEYSLLERYFSFEEINEIETNYLQEAIRQDLPLSDIYYYMSHAIYKGRSNVVVKNERATNLFKSYSDNHIEEFLQSLVAYMRSNEGYYFVNPFACDVWGSWANFKDYVRSISPRTPIVEEFEDFLNQYLDADAKTRIQYKFNYIITKKN